ncbi:VOC family protein [Pseudomonadales bacterium]|nr:VOC family protein [Pseudomonadales bacterium]
MQPRISMISLGVLDLQASIEFYAQGLELPRLAPFSEEIAFFNLNGTWLSLYPWDKLAEEAQVAAKGSGFRGVALAHNVSSKEAVDALIEQAVSAGAKLIKQPEMVFWGGYSGYFADLDDHLWEIAWNPYAWIGPENL